MVGYGRGDKSICVTYLLPHRKKPCLVIHDGNTTTKVASFNNEESARVFFDFLAKLDNLPMIDWNGDDIPFCLRPDIGGGEDEHNN